MHTPYYTVGIKRRWFGYKKYKVIGQTIDSGLVKNIPHPQGHMPHFIQYEPKLVLRLVDGGEITFPHFWALGIKVYPDYEAFAEYLKKRDEPVKSNLYPIKMDNVDNAPNPTPDPAEEKPEVASDDLEDLLKLKDDINRLKTTK